MGLHIVAHFESEADQDHVKRERQEEDQAARDTGMVGSSSDDSEEEENDDVLEVEYGNSVKNTVFLVKVPDQRRQTRIRIETIVKQGNTLVKSGFWPYEALMRYYQMETEEQVARGQESTFLKLSFS